MTVLSNQEFSTLISNDLSISDDVQVGVNVNQSVLEVELSQVLNPAKHDDSFSDHINSAEFNVGIDEVGRGPLYGNVVVSAVIFPHAWSYELDKVLDVPLANTPLAGLTDSKKISEKKRNILKPRIETNAIGYVTVDVPASVIDEINIYQATLLGMKIASESLIVALLKSLTRLQYDAVNPMFNLLIDGNAMPKFEWHSLLDRYCHESSNIYNDSGIDSLNFDACQSIKAENWIKGDARHTSIAAASVLAKVRRDSQLIAAAEQYPEYGFDKHKGYPTKVHLQALEHYGALPEHRRSFKPVQRVLMRDSQHIVNPL